MPTSKVLNLIEFPNLTEAGLSLKISRVAFTVFGINIYWYGIIITAAIALGVIYGTTSAKREGLWKDDIFEIAFLGLIGGIVGARAYFVIFSENKMSLYDAVFGIRDGGLAIYGGIIGSVLMVLIFSKIKKVKFAPFADLIGIGFLLGQGIGRWGNFFNQEAFGAPTAGSLPWGMTGDIISKSPEVIAQQYAVGAGETVLVHPCFLYESLWCLLGFVLLHFYSKKLKSFDGEIFLMYIAWYGIGRMFIESLRTDSLIAGNFRVSQVLAAASAAVALFLIVFFKVRLGNKSNYKMYRDTDESKAYLERRSYSIILENEKEKAKLELKKTKREFSDPFEKSTLGLDENDDKK